MAFSWGGPETRRRGRSPSPSDKDFTIDEDDFKDDFFIPRTTTSTDFVVNSFQKELASECALCGQRLGKHLLKPRHHCRICLQAVCNACSPNAIQMTIGGRKGTHRCCKACAVNAEKAPAMRSRLENVVEKIRMVSGTTGKGSFTFAGNMLGNVAEPEVPAEGQCQSLEDAVSACEFAASSLMSAFHSHQSTKLKIQEVESEIVEQKAARERLETVAQRVDEAENEAAEERQARKQLEAKIRLAKNDCVRLAERLCVVSGSQVQASRTASLEDAIAYCDSAVVRLEALLDEERTARKKAETEKQEVVSHMERHTKQLQGENMKLRADVTHEQKLRREVQDSILQSMGSQKKTTLSGSLSPRSSVPSDSVDSERLLYQSPMGTGCSPNQSVRSSSRTPEGLRSVQEDCPDDHSHHSSGPSSADLPMPIPSEPSRSRLDACKSSCAVS